MTNSLEIVDSVEDDYYDVDADNSNDSLTLLGHNKNSDDVVPWFFTDKTMSLSGKSDVFKKYMYIVCACELESAWDRTNWEWLFNNNNNSSSMSK